MLILSACQGFLPIFLKDWNNLFENQVTAPLSTAGQAVV
jgi:hypothetical protein